MVDVFSRQKRSEIMSRVRGQGNALTELRLIELFRAHRITGWRRNARLFGKPDFVFPKLRLAVFVDGCFWHGCPDHGRIPASNKSFWRGKIHRNVNRDRQVNQALKRLGWKTVRIWQHEFRESSRLVRRLRRTLDTAHTAKKHAPNALTNVKRTPHD